MEKLGEELGRTKATVSGWEKGDYEPSVTQMLSIARLTKADPSALDGWPPAADVQRQSESIAEAPANFGDLIARLGTLLQDLAPTRRRLIATHSAEVLERGPAPDTAETLNDLARGVRLADMQPGSSPAQVEKSDLTEFFMIAKLFADTVMKNNPSMKSDEFILTLQANWPTLRKEWRASNDAKANKSFLQVQS